LIVQAKKIFSKRAVQIGSLTAAIAATTYLRNQPKVETVLVSDPIRQITIRGSKFGSKRWGSYAWLHLGDLSLKLRRGLSWTDREIQIDLPEGFNSGSVTIVKRLGLIRWTSDPISFSVKSTEHHTEPNGYQIPVEPDHLGLPSAEINATVPTPTSKPSATGMNLGSSRQVNEYSNALLPTLFA
jgi:hypothetical protein